MSVRQKGEKGLFSASDQADVLASLAACFRILLFADLLTPVGGLPLPASHRAQSAALLRRWAQCLAVNPAASAR